MKESFPDELIKEQLSRILSATSFKGSLVLSEFLRFIIQEKLAGRQADLKEYTIGVNALSRKTDFNPQIDAIVRIHAGRLRRALKTYYTEEGRQDTLRVDIPKGSYIPEFSMQNEKGDAGVNEKKKPARIKPVVAVFPFRNINPDPSRDFFADGLGEQLSTELTWFRELMVISYYSSRHIAGKTHDLKEAARALGADYVLTGSIQSDGKRFRVSVQLIQSDTGAQLWVTSFEQNFTASGVFRIQNEIVRNILTAIGGYYGAIFRDVLQTSYNSRIDRIETYDAIFWYYHYQKVYSGEVLHKTIAALEAAVETDPDYALAWAMLGELYLDDKAMEFKKIEDPLQLGLTCALRSVKIDPNCQHGYLALAWAYLFYHNREECVKAVDRCLAINPNSADMVGAMGFALTCAGEFERGAKLLNDSIQHNPYCPWWFKGGLCFYFLYKKEYKDALQWAEKIDNSELLWDPLLKSVALGHLNRAEEGGKYLHHLSQLLPDTGNQVKNVVGSFLLSAELNGEIMEGLTKAGLK